MNHQTPTPHPRPALRIALSLLLVALTASLPMGCRPSQPSAPTPAPPAESHAHGHHHTHEAPRGGTLVELGDHVAHIEFVLEADKGTLHAYILDAHAQNALRIGDVAIDCVIVLEGENAQPFSLPLTGQMNLLTGEDVGATSTFKASAEQLVGAERFSVTMPNLIIKGIEIPSFTFSFPEGSQ